MKDLEEIEVIKLLEFASENGLSLHKSFSGLDLRSNVLRIELCALHSEIHELVAHCKSMETFEWHLVECHNIALLGFGKPVKIDEILILFCITVYTSIKLLLLLII